MNQQQFNDLIDGVCTAIPKIEPAVRSILAGPESLQVKMGYFDNISKIFRTVAEVERTTTLILAFETIPELHVHGITLKDLHESIRIGRNQISILEEQIPVAVSHIWKDALAECQNG